MEKVEVEQSCSIHKMEIDEIGFIYRTTEIKHGPDGEMFVTLTGESMVSGKPMSLSFDARTVPADRFDKLRYGDFIEFNCYTEGNA